MMYPKKEEMKRLEEILGVLIHQGFDYLLAETKLLRYLPLTKRVKARMKQHAHIPLPVRVRLSFEQLGPTFVKLGQLLSIRPDLVPYQFIVEFEKMQDKGPEIPFSTVKGIIEKAMSAPLRKTFLQFNEKPIASASLAQVHKAQLKNKDWVAVKVRRPGIKEQMETDFGVMEFLARVLQRHFPNPYQFPKIVDEFQQWSRKEIDFRNELVNAKIFREHAQETKLFYIPKAYDALSSEEVFITEYLDGISLHDLALLRKKRYNVRNLLEKGCRAIIVQVFDKGFFHADPHPGNVLVLKKGQIAFVDFGIIGQFDERLKRKSLEFLWGITNNDGDLALTALYGINANGIVNDRAEFDRKIKQIIYPLRYTTMRELKITEALKNMFQACAEHGVSIPVDFILFGKTIATMEGIALRYDPGFSLVKVVGETLDDLMKKRFSPRAIYKHMKTSTIQLVDFLDEFPRYAKEITDRLRSGKLTMDIEAGDVRALTNELEHSSGNVSLGLIIAALVISSSILFQYPVYQSVAIFGYIVAAILGVWLIRHTIYLFHKQR